MKKEQKTVKNKTDKRQVLTRIMAGVLMVAMVLASCSTLIYYVVANV